MQIQPVVKPLRTVLNTGRVRVVRLLLIRCHQLLHPLHLHHRNPLLGSCLPQICSTIPFQLQILQRRSLHRRPKPPKPLQLQGLLIVQQRKSFCQNPPTARDLTLRRQPMNNRVQQQRQHQHPCQHLLQRLLPQ